VRTLPSGGAVMDDFVYVGLAIGFFALTWAFVALCERV
jgi:hypothetical protein